MRFWGVVVFVFVRVTMVDAKRRTVRAENDSTPYCQTLTPLVEGLITRKRFLGVPILTEYLGLAKVELLSPRSLLQLSLRQAVLFLVGLVELETRLKLAD